MSDRIPGLKNTIVIIVSHSGGTFAPLAISNLLQSVTRNIFVVASEVRQNDAIMTLGPEPVSTGSSIY